MNFKRLAFTIAATTACCCVNDTALSNLIVNGSFEAIPNNNTGQGRLPSDWVRVTSTADTYSNDGSYGLSPNGFGNFPGVTAVDGKRWVAGGAFGRAASSASVGGESFGTILATTLTPGEAYLLDAQLYQALRSDLDNPGGYHLFLATDNTASGRAGAFRLGALSSTTGVDAWEARSLRFIAPRDANLRPFLIFAPYQASDGNAYPGIDAVSLLPVPEPSITVLLALGIGAVSLRFRTDFVQL
jgi:hypothetical protein